LGSLREEDIVLHVEIAVQFPKELLQTIIELAIWRGHAFWRAKAVACSPYLAERSARGIVLL
jgi:hypothetical protein